MRIRIGRGTAVALAVPALLLTSACGGGDDDKGAAKPDKSADQQAQPEAAAAKTLTAEQMKAATLTVADLPSGWKESTEPTESTVAKADKPECQRIASFMEDKIAGATMGGSADFEGNGGNDLLSEQVFTFEKGAEDHLKGFDGVLSACTSFTVESDGMKIPVKVQKLSVPAAGEESYTFHMSMDLPEIQMKLETDVAVIRQGAALARMAYVPGKADASGKAFEDLVKRAGDKLVKGAQG
ncbi:hypothetical protein GCM10020367_21860 [Streptomyces sannanensis]|uniref:Lipoprotein n=1 Tax=Streptomyces sannanensis TaxID=285536 RepID=A0ABP6S9J4_9ACTN